MGLDFIEVLMDLEDRFDVALDPQSFPSSAGRSESPKEYRELTASDLRLAVETKLRERGADVPANLWFEVRLILAENTKMKPEKILPESRLLSDLRLGG